MSLKYIFQTLFLLILTQIGCKSDDYTQDSDEVIYFEDYESPSHKWGYIDKSGEIAIGFTYDDAGKFSQGTAAVNFKGKWGYINHEGKTIIQFQYKAAHPFRDGMAKVQTFDGQYHFLDMNGIVLETLKFIRAGDFSEGLAKVLLANDWGYINKAGELVIEPIFENAWSFQNGHAKIKVEGKYGVIKSDGSYLLQPVYDRVYTYSEGFVRARKNDEYYFANQEGVEIFGPFNEATDFHEGIAFIKQNDTYLKLSSDGILSEVAEELFAHLFTSIPQYLGSGRWSVKNENSYALLDATGNRITPYRYQQINAFHEETAAYMRDDLWGYLDLEGNEIAAPVFGLAWDFSDGLARAAFMEGIAYVNKSMHPPFFPRYRDMQDFREGLAAVQELE